MAALIVTLSLAIVLSSQVDGEPVLCMPVDTRQLNISFLLFSPRNKEVPEYLRNTDDYKVNSTIYDCTKDTKFIIHGYMSCSDMDWVKVMKESFMEHTDYNVILVDWRNGAWNLDFDITLANMRIASGEIANMIRKLLKDTCSKLNKIHVIGHSMGSQLAGYVGQKLRGTLPRITGLDPGAFHFEDFPKNMRLDKSDAQFVDAYHTNINLNSSYCVCSSGFGVAKPMGHVDFYPNGGSRQPGCPDTIDLVKCSPDYKETLASFSAEEQDDIFCHHQRAPALFSATIGVSSQKLHAYSCDSYESFLNGCCSGSSFYAVYGILADKLKPTQLGQKLKYFIKTSDRPPFF